MNRNGVLAILAGLAIVALCVAALRAPAVLYRFKDPAAVDPSAGLFVLFNPVRARFPEQAAEGVLRQLRSGKCATALAFVEPQRRNDICQRERAYRAVTWTLRDREDRPGRSRLFFSVSRTPLPLTESNVWITVQSSAGRWRPVEFECWY